MRNEIVVGLDDSPSSEAALQWAAQQARSTGAVLRAIHVVNEVQDAYRQAITGIFDAVSPPPDWSLEFAEGETGEVLVRQSKDADLLVVGTREHAGLGRLLLGSVSHYCLTHSSCPVVAVPAPAQASGAADAAGSDVDIENVEGAVPPATDEAESDEAKPPSGGG